MTTTSMSTSPTLTTTKQRVGLVLCGLFCLSNVPSFLQAPSDGEAGPPVAILVVSSVVALIGVVATVLAWRGNRVALRVAAGAMIVITLTGLPAFFVDVPMAIKALVGLSVVLTVVAVVLMFSTDRRSAAVTD